MNKYTKEIVDKLLSGRPFKLHPKGQYRYKLIASPTPATEIGYIEENGCYNCNVEKITITFIKVFGTLCGHYVKANILLSKVIFEPENIVK